MAIINIARGGTPDLKIPFCSGAYQEYTAPYDAPHQPHTPPFDSHADGAYTQGGAMNLHFPLVPNLADTYAHKWQQEALRGVKAVGDVVLTNWIPLRSYLSSYYIEVSATDASLNGVYIAPKAYRHSYDYATNQWIYNEVTDFATALSTAGITQFPLGTPSGGDKVYGVVKLSTDAAAVPMGFGHNLVTRNAQGEPTAGLDANYGAVLIGWRVTAGDAAKVATIWKSNIAVYTTAKCFTFEGSTQVG